MPSRWRSHARRVRAVAHADPEPAAAALAVWGVPPGGELAQDARLTTSAAQTMSPGRRRPWRLLGRIRPCGSRDCFVSVSADAPTGWYPGSGIRRKEDAAIGMQLIGINLAPLAGGIMNLIGALRTRERGGLCEQRGLGAVS